MNILDKGFKYIPSNKTNISKTFARIRRELAEKAKETQMNVTQIKKRAMK